MHTAVFLGGGEGGGFLRRLMMRVGLDWIGFCYEGERFLGGSEGRGDA